MNRYVQTAICLCSILAFGDVQAATVMNSKAAQAVPKAYKAENFTLDDLLNPSTGKYASVVPALREQMLQDAGRTVGFQGGWISRSQVLKNIMEERADKLEGIFQFATLISKDGTLPPVIVEAQNVASFSRDQIRTASRVYRIEREERFVSAPPGWRDYLYTGLAISTRIDKPHTEVLPDGDAEMSIWKAAVKSGWEYGEQQADDILNANMNRLVRDYVGMLRYSTLLQQNMVTQTKVAELQQTVTGDGKEIIIGDTLRRVVEKAEFQTDAKRWRPAIARSRGIIKDRDDVIINELPTANTEQ